MADFVGQRRLYCKILESHILYSTNTWLAYRISEFYYSNKHYVWCSPFFDGDDIPKNEFTVPPSSTPKKIGEILADDILYSDRHSDKIKSNKKGLIKGAKIKLEAGLINKNEYEDILKIVDQAPFRDFRPLLYLIPYANVKNQIKKVDVSMRAHPLSEEYIIEELDRKSFDLITLNI